MKTAIPKVLEQLEQVGGGLSDGQLLARFVAARDEAAFTALLRRHGPMVFAVCRRVLHNLHDAEDAFQATFLILARKATSVLKRDSVGCWLHAVAYHTALEAAQANQRRRARERQVRDVPQPDETPGTTDWRPLLDRELNRLSEKYRAALVLCDLEGRPQREVARLLGVPTGTLSSRLMRARALLAKRLLARGVALSAGALAALVVADAASAQVPAVLVGSTVRVAALVAAGQLTAGTPAVLLMKGAMKAMLLNKLRVVVGGVMVAVALGAVGFACRPGDSAQAQTFAPPATIDPTNPLRTAPVPAPPNSVRMGSFVTPEPTTPAATPQNELEKLREENDYLKRNIRVLLDRIKTLEGQQNEPTDPRLPKGSTTPRKVPTVNPYEDTIPVPVPKPQPKSEESRLPASVQPGPYLGGGPRTSGDSDPLTPSSHGLTKEVENALNAVRDAKDQESRLKALESLEKAIKELRKSSKPDVAK